MREIDVTQITNLVKEMCIESNLTLNDDLQCALKKGREIEESKIGKEVFNQLLQNAEYAKKDLTPLCQDTGIAVVFIEIGQDVHLVGGDLKKAVYQGVSQGYEQGYLRKSMVKDPLNRVNTQDNTPPIIHTELVPGDKIKITIAPKGGGSENMSRLAMLKPSDGKKGIIDFVIETIEKAGANPCPPIIVGVGIGGNFEYAAYLAKKALLQPVGQTNHELEKELLDEINKLGIGPQGFGGRMTALDVNILTYSCHIASLPIAVNLNCHTARHTTRYI
ncbi:fumarate hydratase [Natranaerobius trueperi]|uniref:Fumarate hydratase n=1 Tax=Natranaerobius trueperi TaxID=759412 RepID=A0A226BWY1_9FIRM|nr:fumarate hydratase [Natranaerobius trueperi]OWZ83421.1 fumarate hydratase [Natranaerobius trueperi]